MKALRSQGGFSPCLRSLAFELQPSKSRHEKMQNRRTDRDPPAACCHLGSTCIAPGTARLQGLGQDVWKTGCRLISGVSEFCSWSNLSSLLNGDYFILTLKSVQMKAGDVAQSTKYLVYKHDDLSSVPRATLKARHGGLCL